MSKRGAARTIGLYQGLRIGIVQIRAHKLQSFLTLFGVAVGITSVLVMTGIMAGFKEHMESGIRRSGPGRIFVWPRDSISNQSLSAGLSYEDAVALRRSFPDVKTVSPSVNGYDDIHYRDLSARVMIRGITPEWTKVDWNYTLKGRFISEEDVRTYAKVCVLIKKRKTAMEFWRQQDALDPIFKRFDPLGKTVRLAGVAFRVVGIIEEGPRDFMMNFEMGTKNVLVPITALQHRITGNQKTLFLVDVDSGDVKTAAALGARVRAFLKRRHRGVEDFKIEDVATKMGAAMKNTALFGTVMGFIAAISLFAGGVGIMNITLASVHARIKEIGIRKSVGARERDIQSQFLLEAIALSATGGLLGVLAGCGVCVLVQVVAHMPAFPSAGSIATSLLVSVGVGILSAWYPARQASRLDPIEALRYE